MKIHEGSGFSHLFLEFKLTYLLKMSPVSPLGLSIKTGNRIAQARAPECAWPTTSCGLPAAHVYEHSSAGHSHAC